MSVRILESRNWWAWLAVSWWLAATAFCLYKSNYAEASYVLIAGLNGYLLGRGNRP